MSISLERVSQADRKVVNITLVNPEEVVRGTIEMIDRETVRIDAPYSGYRRSLISLDRVVLLED